MPHKRCIAVVDDDTSVLRALRRIIAGAGFEVRTFERAHSLLEAQIPEHLVCLLIDLHMPEMSGMELCATLGAARCLVPIILITGATNVQTSELVREVGAVAILNKPFKKSELFAALARAFALGFVP